MIPFWLTDCLSNSLSTIISPNQASFGHRTQKWPGLADPNKRTTALAVNFHKVLQPSKQLDLAIALLLW
jgi:hypothetical protein